MHRCSDTCLHCCDWPYGSCDADNPSLALSSSPSASTSPSLASASSSGSSYPSASAVPAMMPLTSAAASSLSLLLLLLTCVFLPLSLLPRLQLVLLLLAYPKQCRFTVELNEILVKSGKRLSLLWYMLFFFWLCFKFRMAPSGNILYYQALSPVPAASAPPAVAAPPPASNASHSAASRAVS